MHGKAFVGVAGGLERAADLTDLHVAVLFRLIPVTESLELGLLLLKLFNLFHDCLSVLNLTFFTKLLSVLVIQVDLGLELVNFLINTLLLQSIHLLLCLHLGRGVVPSLWCVFRPGQTSLDFLVDLRYHLCQLND